MGAVQAGTGTAVNQTNTPRRMVKLESFGFCFAEILALTTILLLSHFGLVEVEEWLVVILIVVLVLLTLIQLWELKVFLKPNLDEKFCLTIQGSHERKASRHRRTVYGVTVSDEVRVDYERNPDGILVFFRKVTSMNSKKGPCCQPFFLPFRGWFTFFHGTIAVALFIFFMNNNISGANYPSSFLLLTTAILEMVVMMSTYFSAEDCGCCFITMSYTRWYKHTNAYTEMIQERIQTKHGQKLDQEGEQLETAVKINMMKREVEGVTYHDVGPQTAKRYQDQVVLLHLLLAQEHDQVCKQVFQEHNIENKGVSFTMTADEINTLEKFAKEAMDETIPVETDDTVIVIDASEIVSVDANIKDQEN